MRQGGISRTCAYTATGSPQLFIFNEDGADNWVWYIDGQVVSSGNSGSVVGWNPLINIGAFWSNTDYTFDGTIYELRVYDRVLPAAEVWAMYKPDTRWELYEAPWRVAARAPVGVARIPRPTAAYNNLAIY
jgi:hypothetical protein